MPLVGGGLLVVLCARCNKSGSTDGREMVLLTNNELRCRLRLLSSGSGVQCNAMLPRALLGSSVHGTILIKPMHEAISTPLVRQDARQDCEHTSVSLFPQADESVHECPCHGEGHGITSP